IAAKIGLRWIAALLEVVAHDAKLLKHIAAHIHALVAGDASILLELCISGFLRGGNGVGVTTQKFVKARIWRDQGPLESRYGMLDIRPGDPVFVRRDRKSTRLNS